MRRRIEFELNLIPLESGGWNFYLQAVNPPWITRGYFSPLASYITQERAIHRAREHASRIARSAGARIGRFRITAGTL